MPAGTPFCEWVEQLVVDGISEGCDEAGNFCPNLPVTRGQLAMFLERAMRGTDSWSVDADLLDGQDSSEFVTASALTWASLFFQIVVVTFASYLLWFWLIRHYPATRLASFTLLTPVFGLLLGALLLGEPITARLVVALLAVALGIVVVNRR